MTRDAAARRQVVNRLAQTMTRMRRRLQQQAIGYHFRRTICREQAPLHRAMKPLRGSCAAFTTRVKRLESALLQQVSIEPLQVSGLRVQQPLPRVHHAELLLVDALLHALDDATDQGPGAINQAPGSPVLVDRSREGLPSASDLLAPPTEVA